MQSQCLQGVDTNLLFDVRATATRFGASEMACDTNKHDTAH
jgi:hypothetical protein